MTDEYPALAKRSMGTILKRLRGDAGLSCEDAAESLGYRRHTVWRIENGKQGTTKPVIESLCNLYNAPPEIRSELFRMVGESKESKKRGLWRDAQFGVAPKWQLFVEQEQDASEILAWEPELIPGLSQTIPYMKALQAAQKPLDPSVAEAIREFRVKRQDGVWRRRPAPKVSLLVGEAALRHLDGLPDLKGEQVDRLLELALRPTVNVRIIRGLHPNMFGAYTILAPRNVSQFNPPFVYIEGLDGSRYVEDVNVVSEFEQAFRASFKLAIPIEEYQL